MSLSTVLVSGDSLAIRTRVQDSAGNVRYFPSEDGASGVVPGGMWDFEEDFAGLAAAAAVTTLPGWIQIRSNGAGQLRGVGNGTVNVIRQSGTATSPGEYLRYDQLFGTSMEAEIDIAPGIGGTATFVELAVRVNPASGSRYVAHFYSNGTLQLRRAFATNSGTLLATAIDSTDLPKTRRLRAQNVDGRALLQVFAGASLIAEHLENDTPLSGTAFGFGLEYSGSSGNESQRIDAVRARIF